MNHGVFGSILFIAALLGAPRVAAAESVIRVRVYVDDNFRREVFGWPQEIRQIVREASAAFEKQGVRLELDAIHEWSHQTEGALVTDLEALSTKDRGIGVDIVVAFVGAQTIHSDSMHQYGFASIGGKHAVIRNLHIQVSREQVSATHLPWNVTDEMVARVRHKRRSVLLHEIGHTLGATHSRDPHDFMHPMYRRHQTSFGPEAIEAMSTILSDRDRRRQPFIFRTAPAPVEVAPVPTKPEPKVRETIDDIRLIEGSETDQLDCKVVGMSGANTELEVKSLPDTVRDEFLAKAKAKQADTILVSKTAKQGRLYWFANLYRCTTPS
ncbi:MAG: matrixin family metalloprotease [Myxococcota bacterium]